MLKIKPFKQSKGFCGPACFKMVLDYYGVKHSEMYWGKLTAIDINKKTGKINRNKGCSEDKFIAIAKNMGFKGFCKDHSSLVEVRKLIQKKIPVIVDWFSPEQGPHFSVVVGFRKNKIILADPYFGKFKKWTIKEFEERWFDHMPYPIKSLKDLRWVRRICVVYK